MLCPVSVFTAGLHCRSRGPTTGGEVNLVTATITTTRTTMPAKSQALNPLNPKPYLNPKPRTQLKPLNPKLDYKDHFQDSHEKYPSWRDGSRCGQDLGSWRL